MLEHTENKDIFKDKLILVTGASRGIGKAIAQLFAKFNDAIVIGTATTEKGADGITAELASYNKLNCGLVLDIAKRESILRLLAGIEEIYGKKGPDILINNAGVTKDNLILRMKDEEWDNVINTNLSGVFNLTKACIKSMVKNRWGRIINISSVIGVTGNAGQVNYAAAKAGLIGMSKSLVKEVSSRGITINVVAPGYIETDMTGYLSESQKKQLEENIPLGRVGSALDIANSVVFLASPMAEYITGQTLHVNGGMYMS